MEVNLQKFENKNYQEYLEFYNRVHPDNQLGLEVLKETEGRYSAGAFMERYLLYSDNELIAATSLKQDLNKSSVVGIIVNMVIEPEYQHLEKILFTELLKKAQKHKPDYYKTSVRENWQHELDFYLQNGFVEIERMWESWLDLSSFDPKAFDWAEPKALANGISFKTLADFEDNEASQRMIYDLVSELLADVPHGEELEIWPFELWLERFWKGNLRIDESMFLAFDGKQAVGLSMLLKGRAADAMGTGLTGVKKNYRRKGIAQALKLQAAKYALDHGFAKITTSNHSINRPMLSINEAMGFEKEPAWVYLKKEINN